MIHDPDRWWPAREAWPEFPPLPGHALRPGAFEALALLVLDEVVVPLASAPQDATVALLVGCNDLFWCGCADAERIPPIHFGADLEAPFWDLYDAVRANGQHGALRWCCLRRGMRPQAPIERRWREAGLWDEALEALPVRDKEGE